MILRIITKKYTLNYYNTIVKILLAIVLITGLKHYRPSATLAAPNREVLTDGTVLQLDGTPHLWVYADRALHWAGDTRALQGHIVEWGTRRTVTVFQLKSFTIGDPWLSTGLVKVGDPIYLPKWETDQSSPELLHIQNISDVELFGITSNNYGKMIFDQRTWESQTGVMLNNLTRSSLPSAVKPSVPPTAVPTAAPVTPAYCPSRAAQLYAGLDSVLASQRLTNASALRYGQDQASGSILRQVSGTMTPEQGRAYEQKLYDSLPGKAGDSFTLRFARQVGYVDISDAIDNFYATVGSQLQMMGCPLNR